MSYFDIFQNRIISSYALISGFYTDFSKTVEARPFPSNIPEIFVLKVESYPKSRSILDVLRYPKL